MRKTLIAASVLALVAGSASAATVSYTESASLPSTINPISTTLNVAAFNAALGVLSGVSVKLTGGTLADLTLDCLKGFSCTFTTANSGSTIDVTGSGLVSTVNLSPTGSPIVPLTITDATLGTTTSDMFGGTANGNRLSFIGLTGSDAETVTILDFTDYDGIGEVSVAFDIAGTNQTLIGATGPQSSSGLAESALDIEITYTYTTADVPVPAALPLLATAFGALGLLRLRRKA